MKLKTVITAALALGGIAFAGCSTTEAPQHETRAKLQGLSCNDAQGMNAMKASLAVAMAREIGRIDPVKDLRKSGGVVVLKNGAKAECNSRGHGNCPNTAAILGMAGFDVNNYLDQTVFNATSYREDLKASFDRQRNHENNLAMNAPHQLPGEHETFHTSTSDYGACGIHYDFDVVGDDVQNLEERMVFFGGDQNPFIDFRSTDSTISIDPTGTMEGDSGTSSGMCHDICYGYQMGRLRGDCCFCNGQQGTLRKANWDQGLTYCKL